MGRTKDKLIGLRKEIMDKIEEIQECAKKNKNKEECIANAILFLAFILGYIDGILEYDLEE